MAKTTTTLKPLTPADVNKFRADQSHFFDRLEATIALVDQGLEIKRVLSHFVASNSAPAAMANYIARTPKTKGIAKAAVKAKGQKKRLVKKSGEIQEKITRVLAGLDGGLSIGEIAEKAGEESERVKYAIQVMRSAKSVRMTGNRATARYSMS